MIIVEGCDCSGKTTFIEQLIKTYKDVGTPVTYFHATQHTQQHEYIELLTAPDNRLVIMDRSWISEEVYGPVMRGSSRNDPAFMASITGLLTAIPTTIIHVTASLATLKKRFVERGDDYITLEKLEEISKAYNKLFAHSVYMSKPVIMLRTDV